MATKKRQPARLQVIAPPRRASLQAKARRATPSTVLAKLREICQSMPGAVEKESHGEPTWFAGERGRVFAMFDNHHHDAPHVSVWLPTPRELQQALVQSDPSKYFVPPYVGSKGWVGVVLDEGPDWKVVRELVREAFASVTNSSPRARASKR